MKIKNITTVWHDGSPLLIDDTVADCMHLSQNYKIRNDAEFWRILEANCRYNIIRLEREIAAQEATVH